MVRNETLYKDDKHLGNTGENATLLVINKIFKDCKKTKEKYNYFDFRDDTEKIDFELKTRRVIKGQYPTVFFAEHKLLSGRERIKEGITKRVIYLFCFKSKKDPTKQVLYFWEDDLKDYTINMCGNFKRNEKAKPLIDLDITKLKSIRHLLP
tara:strand:+ start:1474 stop:1929 length:456 start_codon:yes stop_codon:yes gene_type:complete